MRILSVNVDHVATVRQARRESFPDPCKMALEAEAGGADGITCHLRSDRRHIQDDDVRRLKECINGELNVEMAATDEMVDIIREIKPHQVSLVPERPEEVTTQGGLDLVSRFDDVKPYVKTIVDAGIRLSFFIECEEELIKRAFDLGASNVEFNTDAYAINPDKRSDLVSVFRERARFAAEKGLEVHIGHGLDYDNISPLMEIGEIKGASIGFAIVARALEVGMRLAVNEMAKLMGKDV
ncbi:pyridoxine 5'-phosphate synthase [candidate division WOR-3 bacterium]|uniref:Pyridoxine 5'-phosphate synthase n=1 Tax=candidate division WOR-3 bacterium TaxID=2052148 RepID=A0A9D5K8A9_UNCW3|nr:pyridoxine 5'-phosphate synthase [candidate division WOR-3 bacterium]MBD3363924.1 pyridoxine 5'-phosphate synthase [candidate division WOR-3 bacterium]